MIAEGRREGYESGMPDTLRRSRACLALCELGRIPKAKDLS
jgi:hypothetical protein